jgi:hypothetical protein
VAKKTTHILSTSANLLGFCLFVITSVHIADKSENNLLDELTSAVAVLLTFSCLCSYIAIRSRNPGRATRMESVADYLFVASLSGILATIILIAFNFL